MKLVSACQSCGTSKCLFTRMVSKKDMNNACDKVGERNVNCSYMKYTTVRKKRYMWCSLLMLQLCLTHAIVYVSANVCVCECMCVGGGGTEQKDCPLPNCSTKNVVMTVECDRLTCTVLFQISGSTLTWAEVITELC